MGVQDNDVLKKYIDGVAEFDEQDEDLISIADKMFDYISEPPMRLRALKQYIKNQKQIVELEEQGVWLYKKELDYLATISDTEIKLIFYALILESKWGKIPQKWVKFDKKSLKMVLNPTKIEVEKFRIILNYGLDFRVCGSNKAVLTFLDPVEVIYGDRDLRESDIQVLYVRRREARKIFEEVVCKWS